MKNKDVILAFLEKRKALGSNLYSDGNKLINYKTTLAQWMDNYHLIVNDTWYSQTSRVNQNYLKNELIPERGIVDYHIKDIDKGTKNLIEMYRLTHSIIPNII